MSRSLIGPIIIMFIALIGLSSDDHVYLNAPIVEASVPYEETDLQSMIVPHHLVATDKLEAMYKTAASDEVKRIVLISPDHFLDEDRDMTTSDKNWYVDEGNVMFDQVLYDEISSEGIGINPAVISKEHGLYTHIPYIKRYFPNASVVPIAISKQTDFKYLSELINTLPEDVFLIASVDFSHYLSLEEANENDEITKSILLNGNYETFFELNDAYFDTPACLYVISCYARKHNYEMVFYDHSNAAYYMGLNIPETTSYFFIGFK